MFEGGYGFRLAQFDGLGFEAPAKFYGFCEKGLFGCLVLRQQAAVVHEGHGDEGVAEERALHVDQGQDAGDSGPACSPILDGCFFGDEIICSVPIHRLDDLLPLVEMVGGAVFVGLDEAVPEGAISGLGLGYGHLGIS